MNVKERMARAFCDFYQEHSCNPRRITVSQEVASELEALILADESRFNGDLRDPGKSPTQLRDGNVVYFRGVLVVADMGEEHVLDIR